MVIFKDFKTLSINLFHSTLVEKITQNLEESTIKQKDL